MASGSDRWRALTPDELAAEPDARFGGTIAVLFFAAAFALTPLAFLAISALRDLKGTTWVVLMMLGQASGGDMKSALIASSFLQMLTLMLWAATFVAVTLLKSRNGPTIAAVIFAIAALIGPVGQYAIAAIVIGGVAGLYQSGAQLPHMVLNLVAAVAFWAYMREGRRPNAYFRGRLPVAAVA